MAQRETQLVDGPLADMGEEGQVLQWRVDQLCQLGFTFVTAVRLANGLVDLNEARKLIAHGCTVETATRILL